MAGLYPLKFKPFYLEKIWGGNRIRTILGKDFGDAPNCGESWELSAVEGYISEVSNGYLAGNSITELIEIYMGDLVGEQVYQKFGIEFPLLLKFIDTNEDLSIQVHPGNKLAKERHNAYGKTEMWYVIHAEEGALINSGFNQSVSKEQYLEQLENNTLTNLLHYDVVYPGDVFFIPAGRVHTIGKGILLAEIQQTSDITYRIYDFDRKDDQGNARELHVEEALDAMDYRFYDQYKTPYVDALNEPVELAKCEYFQTRKIRFNQSVERDYSDIDSFIIYICYEGKFEIRYDGKSFGFAKGEAALLPASVKSVTLVPGGETKILETFVP